MKISVIVPSLNPDEKLVEVVNGLIKEGFDDIIVVNDGSNEEHMLFLKLFLFHDLLRG